MSKRLLFAKTVRPAGSVNLIGLMLFLALAGGIYWLAMFAPAYLDNLDVKEALTGAFNDASMSQDSQLRVRILAQVSKVGTHRDASGAVVPGLEITPSMIVIQRDEVEHTIALEVEYDRAIVLWPSKRIRTLHFRVQQEGPLRFH